MKNYANCRNCDVTVLVAAQDKCEATLKWINQVEKRLQTEQIYLDQKQLDRKVDFVPFASGTAVSIYEFFMKFEAWARGRLSKDTMANVLYTEYLVKTITHWNKELEEIRFSYSSRKAWLFRMYGQPDTVADLYLNNIRKVERPTSKGAVAGACRQAKEVYGHIITLTTLEESEGQPITALQEHIYRNQFLKSLVSVLPKSTRQQFMQKLGDEDIYNVAGKPYIKDIIGILKNEYRRLEMEAEIEMTEASSGSDSEEEPVRVPTQFSSSPKKLTKKMSVPPQSVNVAAAQQFAALPPTPMQTGFMPQPVVAQPMYPVPQFAQQPQAAALVSNPATGLLVSNNVQAMQFAPPINKTPMTYGPPPAPNTGPRWACPVRHRHRHSNAHEVGVCQEFWTAANNKARRDFTVGATRLARAMAVARSLSNTNMEMFYKHFRLEISTD
jgi:hypothetical protein